MQWKNLGIPRSELLADSLCSFIFQCEGEQRELDKQARGGRRRMRTERQRWSGKEEEGEEEGQKRRREWRGGNVQRWRPITSRRWEAEGMGLCFVGLLLTFSTKPKPSWPSPLSIPGLSLSADFPPSFPPANQRLHFFKWPLSRAQNFTSSPKFWKMGVGRNIIKQQWP